MNFFMLLALALGLSMDAFAVSICKGLTLGDATLKKAVIVGLYFGLFQAGMPLIGYIAAYQITEAVSSAGSWIAFGLLCFLGIKMIIGGLKKDGANKNGECKTKSSDENEKCNIENLDENKERINVNYGKKDTKASLGPKQMLLPSLATSTDALAVGASIALLQADILPVVISAGIATFILSAVGVKIGSMFGTRFKSKAELVGGIILILIGFSILL